MFKGKCPASSREVDNVSLDKSGVGSLDKRKLAVFVPYNDKIADINEDDTDQHFLDLATALSESRKIIAVTIASYRNAGTGGLRVFPNEGGVYVDINTITLWGMVVIKNGTQRLQYAQAVANDDFDLYCLGYVVEA